MERNVLCLNCGNPIYEKFSGRWFHVSASGDLDTQCPLYAKPPRAAVKLTVHPINPVAAPQEEKDK